MVDYTALLTLAVEIGRRLQESGAEIYRVEEAVRRTFQAYGVDSGQVFAIPNCLIVSVVDDEGRPLTRMQRISFRGSNVARMERVYGFCRQVCQTAPDVDSALEQLRAVDADVSAFPVWMQLLGYFLGAGAFTLFWGGNAWDAVAGGLCGVAIGLCLIYMGRLNANLFIKTVIASFVSVFLAAALVWLGVGENINYITIGALMALVPGVMFTSFMRAIMAGDLVAGLFKLVEALLTGCAIAVGALVAMAAAAGLWGV